MRPPVNQEQFLAEADAMERECSKITLELRPRHLMALSTIIQMSCRNPTLGSALRKELIGLGKAFQEAIPEQYTLVHQVMKNGWDGFEGG